MRLIAKNLLDALTQHGFLRPFLIFLVLLLIRDVFLMSVDLYALWRRPNLKFTRRKYVAITIATRVIPSVAAAAV